jgi:hypothetical protein
MEDKYQIGEYGWCQFYLKAKGVTQWFSHYGTITRIEKKYLALVDNDEIEYIIEKKNFTFEKHEKP